MTDLDQSIEEIESELMQLRLQVLCLKDKLKTKYKVQLENELHRLDEKLDAIKRQIDESYSNDIEIYTLQRQNYFLMNGIGKEEMKRYLEQEFIPKHYGSTGK